jgi:hypothetical protein
MSPLAACLLVGSKWSSSPTSSLFVLKTSGAMDRSITHQNSGLCFSFLGFVLLYFCAFLLSFSLELHVFGFPRASLLKMEQEEEEEEEASGTTKLLRKQRSF